jgi:hypothetical protein
VNGWSTLTERTNQAERESERARKGIDADNPAPLGSGGGGVGERGGRPESVGHR